MNPLPHTRVRRTAIAVPLALAAAAAATAAAPRAAAAAAGERVAVVVVAAADGDSAAAADLSDVLVATLSARPATELVGREEFVAALRDTAGATDEAGIRRCVEDILCLAKVGASIGARRIFAGRVVRGAGKSDGTGAPYVLTVTVVDPGLGRALREGYRSGGTPADVAAQVPPLLAELLALDRKARLVIESTALGASIEVDGRTAGSGARLELDVDPGRHAVKVSKEGMETFSLKLDVSAGEIRSVSAVLRPPTHPFYTRWWLWTSVAVVAGGAALTAYLIAHRDPLRDADPFFRIGDSR